MLKKEAEKTDNPRFAFSVSAIRESKGITMNINWQKVIFHTLTNLNGEVSYYGEVYLKKSSNWVVNEPVSFAWNLMKISFHYGILKSKKPLRLKGTKEENINLVYQRLKLSQSLKGMLDYKHVIIDLWNSLLVPVLQGEALYQVLEQKLGVEGFAKARKKYQDTRVPIAQIYEKIGKELEREISPDTEMKIVSETVLVNPFVLENIDATAANQIPITAIVDSCYPQELFEKILEEKRIHSISELVVTSTLHMPAAKIEAKYVRKYKKLEKSYPKRVRIFASDYRQYILGQRRKGNTATYYPEPSFFLRRHALPEIQSGFGQVYRQIEGLLNYSRPLSRSEEFSATSLYMAPVAFGFLQEAARRSKGREIVFLGSSRHFLVALFEKYWKKASAIEWSYLAANQPRERKDWETIFAKMPSLEMISADRIAFAMGFEAPEYKLARVRQEFMDCWQNKPFSSPEREDGMEAYLKSCLQGKESVLVVDLTENSMGGESFLEKVREYNIVTDCEYFSLRSYWEENHIAQERAEEAESLFHSILQTELPVLLHIGLEQIGFAQPRMLPAGGREKLYCGMEEYFCLMHQINGKSAAIPEISAEEMCQLLLSGGGAIRQLKRRLAE